MDTLKIIESYNIRYDMYQHSVIKCIMRDNLKMLKWLYKNKYPFTLFDIDYCQCESWLPRMGVDYSRCSHCIYVNITLPLDFAIKENKLEIIEWLKDKN